MMTRSPRIMTLFSSLLNCKLCFIGENVLYYPVVLCNNYSIPGQIEKIFV